MRRNSSGPQPNSAAESECGDSGYKSHDVRPSNTALRIRGMINGRFFRPVLPFSSNVGTFAQTSGLPTPIVSTNLATRTPLFVGKTFMITGCYR